MRSCLDPSTIVCAPMQALHITPFHANTDFAPDRHGSEPVVAGGPNATRLAAD